MRVTFVQIVKPVSQLLVKLNNYDFKSKESSKVLLIVTPAPPKMIFPQQIQQVFFELE
jgi:hypothetical protein